MHEHVRSLEKRHTTIQLKMGDLMPGLVANTLSFAFCGAHKFLSSFCTYIYATAVLCRQQACVPCLGFSSMHDRPAKTCPPHYDSANKLRRGES